MPSFKRSAGASFLDGVTAALHDNPVLWVALSLSLVCFLVGTGGGSKRASTSSGGGRRMRPKPGATTAMEECHLCQCARHLRPMDRRRFRCGQGHAHGHGHAHARRAGNVGAGADRLPQRSLSRAFAEHWKAWPGMHGGMAVFGSCWDPWARP